MVPRNILGTVLHPLNEPKRKRPNLYAEHAEKYAWRKETMAQTIPILNCLWNDVLHFSPVHPKLARKGLQEVGFELGLWRVFEIEAARLEPERTVLYRHLHQEHRGKLTLPGNFTPFQREQLSILKHLPERTEAYYAEKFRKNERPLMFVGVPHVRHRGCLDIEGVRVLKLEP